MINSESTTDYDDSTTQREADVTAISQSGARGALALAGLATAVVVAIWFVFYLLVFVPRAIAP